MKKLENITFGTLLRRTASRFPARPAIWYSGSEISYAQLVGSVETCGAALCSQGVKKGDHVAIWADNTVESITAFYAVMTMGAVAVMFNPSLTVNEMTELLRFSDCQYLILGMHRRKAPDWDGVRAVLAQAEAVRRVFPLPEAREPGGPSIDTYAQEAGPADREAFLAFERATRSEDTSVILFTSGTSGRPKAVMTSHYNRVNNGIQQAADLGATEQDRFCAVLPIFHSFTISANLIPSVSVGACIVLPDGRRTEAVVRAIRDAKCTIFNGVPSLYYAILAKPDFDPANFASLRVGIIGGAGYNKEQFIRINNTLGMTLLSSLGQTETTAGSTICRADEPLERRSTTVGRFMDHVEGKIVDIHTGEELPAGHVGEICIRGYLVMQGYYKQPDATREVLGEDGWFHTGDLGALDGEGYLTLHGRCKELIIRGGENISPMELEGVIHRLPQVGQTKVVGVPDAHFGEEICACLTLREGQSLTAGELREFLAGELAYFKVPKYVLFWDKLPITNTGKPDLPAIRARVYKELGIRDEKE